MVQTCRATSKRMFGCASETWRRSSQAALYVVSLLWLSLPYGSVARAETGAVDERAYEASISEAVAQFQAGQFEAAKTSFQHAHELKPSARTLRGLAVSELGLHHYLEAHYLLRDALADSRRPLPPDQRKEAERALTELQTHLERVRIALTPSSAELRVDHTLAQREADGTLLLQEGEHLLQFSAPSYQAREQVLKAVGGQAETLTIALQPAVVTVAEGAGPIEPTHVLTPAVVPEPLPAPALPASKQRSRMWTWAAFGTGGALTVLGATFLAIGLRDDAKVENAKDGTRWSSIQGAHRSAPVLTGVGIGVGAVGLLGLAAGVWSWKRDNRPDAAEVKLALSPRGAALTGQF